MGERHEQASWAGVEDVSRSAHLPLWAMTAASNHFTSRPPCGPAGTSKALKSEADDEKDTGGQEMY